jgi:dipeptidase E
MRLFLSSENLGRYPQEFLNLLGPNKTLVIVHNAIDDWSPEDRKTKVDNHLEQLKSQGFKAFDFDLRDYFGKHQDVEKQLSKCGGIFIFGGNTFILNRALKYSGAGRALYDMVRKNEIAFGGSSAGSIIATPSLHGSELGDHPEVTPEGYKDEIIWEGLDFVNFYIVPHYKSNWFGIEAEAMLDYFKQHLLPYRALQDGQAILINGDKEEFLK